MFKVAVLGCGKIGETIAWMLGNSHRYAVTIADTNKARVDAVAQACTNTTAAVLDVRDPAALAGFLPGHIAVISALPFFCNVTVAEAAAKVGAHYFDLTEDVAVTRVITDLARTATTCFVPQCGLAPGFVSIAALSLTKQFDALRSVKMRVGALPEYPTTKLKYALTWSTDGLINEYINPCEVIRNGERVWVPALDALEHVSIDGVDYEAFNTSGGLGSLAATLEGKVEELSYKTFRYPGHRDLMAFLLGELRFRDDRSTLKAVLERSLPTTKQDKCMILVEVVGMKDNQLTAKTYFSSVYASEKAGRVVTAIQATTSAGVCAPLDLLLTGALGSRKGIVRLEEFDLDMILGNEFGRTYQNGSVR